DANREVAGAGDQPRAVGAPIDRVDVGVVAAQLRHLRVGRLLAAGPPGDTDVPQADRVVGTAGRQARAVGAEGGAVDHAPVRQHRQGLAGRGVPQAYRPVLRG